MPDSKITEYFKFLEECKDKCYDDIRTQKHHIVPKKMGGDNEAKNLVELSYEDHEKAHFILADCFEEGSYERNMNIWAARFIRKQSELTKEEWDKISESMSGENNPFYGKTHDEETKKILAQKAKKQRKGKSYEEIYGESRAKKEREKRAKKTRTDEEYARDAKKVSKALKKKDRSGGNNPNAQAYVVNGKRFDSRTGLRNR